MKAIRIHEDGGPEVLRHEDVDDPEPGPGEVLVRLRAASLNHLDVWIRKGLPSVPKPRITGADGAGVEWLRLEESGAVTYLAVDRPVRIAVTVTAQAGFGPVQQLSEVIAHALPEQPVCEAGHVTPTDNS